MPSIHLSKRSIDALPNTTEGQAFYWDDQLRGFGLRVGKRSKVFIAEGQLRRRTVRVTLGRYELLGPDNARKRALKVLSDLADGLNPNEAKRTQNLATTTLQAAFDAFFEAKPNLSRNTTPNYKRSIAVYLKEWQAVPIAQVSRQMVLSRHRQIAEDHGAVTANNVMRHLRSIYNYTAATLGDLPPNPVQIVTQARAWAPERRRRTILPLHAFPRWHRAVMDETEQARDFLLIALFTGMRRSEIASLRWADIDLVGATLTVPRTKNGDPLVLPLSTFLADLLAARRGACPEAEWVFPGRGASGHIEEMKTFVDRVSKACGHRFTLHDLRRTFVTVAESLDIPAYALKHLLNHRSGGDVTAGYIVIGTERLRAPVEKIANHIWELCHAGQRADAAGAVQLAVA